MKLKIVKEEDLRELLSSYGATSEEIDNFIDDLNHKSIPLDSLVKAPNVKKKIDKLEVIMKIDNELDVTSYIIHSSGQVEYVDYANKENNELYYLENEYVNEFLTSIAHSYKSNVQVDTHEFECNITIYFVDGSSKELSLTNTCLYRDEIDTIAELMADFIVEYKLHQKEMN